MEQLSLCFCEDRALLGNVRAPDLMKKWLLVCANPECARMWTHTISLLDSALAAVEGAAPRKYMLVECLTPGWPVPAREPEFST